MGEEEASSQNEEKTLYLYKSTVIIKQLIQRNLLMFLHEISIFLLTSQISLHDIILAKDACF